MYISQWKSHHSVIIVVTTSFISKSLSKLFRNKALEKWKCSNSMKHKFIGPRRNRGTETFIPSTQTFIKHVNQVLSTRQIPVSIVNTWTVSWMVHGILRILSVKKLRNHIGKESSSALVTGQGIYLRNKISTKSWFHSCYNPTCSRRWTVRLLLPALSYLHSVEPPAPPLRLASELSGCIQQPQVNHSMFDLSTPGARQDPARG